MLTDLSLKSDKHEVIPTIQNENPPDENILPVFPLHNWQNFSDLDNLLLTNNSAIKQFVSI